MKNVSTQPLPDYRNDNWQLTAPFLVVPCIVTKFIVTVINYTISETAEKEFKL